MAAAPTDPPSDAPAELPPSGTGSTAARHGRHAAVGSHRIIGGSRPWWRPPAPDAPDVVYPVGPLKVLDRRQRFLLRLSQPGMTLALVMLWVSLSPSLLPRTWWMTAVAVGLSSVLGYLVGDLVGRASAWIARRIGLRITLPPLSDWLLRLGWTVLLTAVTVAIWVWSLREQELTAELVGLRSNGAGSQLAGVAAGLALAGVVLLLVRLLALAWWKVRHLARRFLPGVLATAAATVVVLTTVTWLSEGVLYRQGMNAALSSAAQLNAETAPGRTRPAEPERSGSPQSTQSWESLGRDGQVFVADGARRERIAEITGQPAQEPIRLYAGKEGNPSIQDAVDAVLAEMERTGAFDRSVVHVTTTTGTGFVQGWSAGAVEYLAGGDCATVSLQYSYFSSALAYVSDRQSPPEAGRALFDAVHDAWLELPEDRRPLLVVSGESLGSYGMQGAFDSPEELMADVDGAVFSGTPRFTPLWQQFTEQRRPGSPEIAPVVDNGRHVRFVTRPEELGHDYYGGPYAEWEHPRVVYAQHASDPIVWWDPDLLVSEPDWMEEKVGRDVSPNLTWTPWATFWQVGMDQPLSVATDGGHGHQYFEEVVPYWAAVLGQEWSDERVVRIQRALRTDFRPR
ncbi:alpha/beta hydrolase [Micrococcus lylae]|uniref:Alpha/beta-hydrolase family protein n=1 Tax=Micrococcus lylae TaxID=1273 RepID=A0ABY2JWQ7_9MICC|nr:alpha/beta-hydrolase family protein [Micrococcus lylae]TFH97874.1 hypothetical protein E4A49_11395 [Micrococcus lylae]